MGFSHALVAVHGLSPEEVAARLDRTVSDELTSLHVAVTRDTPGWCISPPIDGWTFLVDQTWEILRDEHELARLSAGTWLLASSIEERAMGFDTTCWTDGAYTWEVLATDHQLFVIGAPPPPFADLVRDLTEGSDVVDELDMLSGPPPEEWDRLGFDGDSLPTARATSLGLAVRKAQPAQDADWYLPAVEIFARLTGHAYHGNDRLHHAQLGVLK